MATTENIIEKCELIIDMIIAKEYRDEAKQIIRLTTDKHRQDFLKYHRNDQGNICCLVLDTAMRDLISEGKIIPNEKHAFGNPLF